MRIIQLLILGSLFVFIGSGSAFSSQITVFEPTGGSYIEGTSIVVRYSSTTSVSFGVVEIYKGSTMLSRVPGGPPNTNINISISGLARGTDYRVKVFDGNNVNNFGWSGFFSIVQISPPTANAASFISSNSFTANWSSVSGATEYRIDISTNSTFSSIVANNVQVSGSTSYTFSEGLPGTNYFYRVRSFAGVSTSNNSNTVSVLTAPATPTALAASNITANSFTANWGSVASATSYRLDVSTVSNFSSFVAGYNNLSVTGTSASVSGLTAGTTYFYRVRAVNGSGASGSSNSITVLTIPAAPAATSASGHTAGSFTANWGSVASATSYRLDVSTVSNFSSFVAGYNNLSVTGTSASVSGLTAGTSYFYRVRAVNGTGTSENSNTTTTVTLPAAPSASAATGIGENAFTANWGSVASATSYRLDVSTVSNFSSFVTGYNNLTVNGTNTSVTGLAAGTTYFYRVRAVNGSGASGSSNSITALTIPASPSTTSASGHTASSFTANWGSVPSATSYRLDVSTVSNFSSFVAGYNNLSVTGTSASVSGLTAGTSYFYRVRAVNGTGTSDNSNTTTTLTLAAAPTASSATNISTGSFTANWGSVASATSYRLDVSTTSNFSSFVSGFNNLSVTETSRNVTGLSAGTTYYYRVRAVNGSGTSTNSGSITVVTIPGAPTASAASEITSGTFTANWSSVAGATEYRLDVSTSNTFSSFVTGYNNRSVTGTSVSVIGLISGTTYYYRVRAVNGSGSSGNSNMITVITAPVAPTAFSASNITSSSFTVNWSSVTGATGYRLDVSTNSSFSNFVTGYNDANLSVTSTTIPGLSAGVTYYYRVRSENASGTSGNSSTITVVTIPGAPTATAASNIGVGSFTANWSNSNATHFRLDVSTSSTFSSFVTGYNNVLVNGVSSPVTGLAAGTTYYYRVRGENASGSSVSSNTITVLTVPGAPTALAASNITMNSFTANWGSVASATSYRLDVSTVSNFSSFVAGYNNLTVSGTNASVTGLAAGTTYFFRVRAVNGSGTSDHSNTITVLTIPGAPTALAASNITASSFTANWGSVQSATSYRLDVSTVSNFSSFVTGYNNRTVNETNASVTGLASGTTYFYRIRAVNGSGTSVSSNTISTVTIPAAPSVSEATDHTATSFTARWNSVPSATSYRLDVSTVSNFSSFVPGYNNLSVTGTSRSVTSLNANTIYYYRVRAVNGSGTSANSGTQITQTATVAPTAHAATDILGMSFTANWSSVPGATSYRLDVSRQSSFTNFVEGYHNRTVTGTSVQVTGLDHDVTYYYRVRAVNSGTIASAYSNIISVLTVLYPSYIKSTTIHKAGVNESTNLGGLESSDYQIGYTYYDGLGRPIQSVSVQASPLQKDMVVPMAYDAMGREDKKYLPYVDNSADGGYKFNALKGTNNSYTSSQQYGFYQNSSNNVVTDSKPYAVTIFEPSPLSRIMQQGAAGNDYQPVDVLNHYSTSNKTVKMKYVSNTTADKVRRFEYEYGTEGAFGKVVIKGTYTENELYATESYDEDNNRTVEFKDKQGRVVLKRSYITSVISADTYYVYDDFGNLRLVLQPKGSEEILDSHKEIPASTFNDYCFYYHYDERHRMIEKKVPGAEKVTMFYDKRDRLVLTQDGVQRNKSPREYTYIKYDVMNRPVLTGLWTSAATESTIRNEVKNFSVMSENRVQTGAIGYTTNRTYPTSINTNQILSITYYDDYNYLQTSGLYGFTNEGFQGLTPTTRLKGLVTGSKERVLDSNTLLTTINYYDGQKRLIQTATENIIGGRDVITNIYDRLTSNVLLSRHRHIGHSTIVTDQSYEYDHAGRLLQANHKINQQPVVTMVHNTYNELGELITKELHKEGNNALQAIDYRYNIRGWLTHINDPSSLGDDKFAMRLYYHEVTAIAGKSVTRRYNGNISAQQWISDDGGNSKDKQHVYRYTYDGLNRLGNAHYNSLLSGTNTVRDDGFYDEIITGYDRNGNITGLQRFAGINGSRTKIDHFTNIVWTGNRFTRLDDAADAVRDQGFMDKVQQNNEYDYDRNGNLVKDLNKEINNISYNVLNLPREVQKDAHNRIVYTYTSSGRKLRKQVITHNGTPVITDYAGPLQYTDGSLDFMSTAEGRAVPSLKPGESGRFNYEYFLKDHLGNTRVTLSSVTPEALTYLATMEIEAAGREEQEFVNLSSTRQLDQAFNRTPGGRYSARLNATTGRAIGPGIALRVSAGDEVSMKVYARYVDNGGNHSNLIGNLATLVAQSYGYNPGEASTHYLQQKFSQVPPLVASGGGNIPKAYLSYVFFDRNFNYIASGSGFRQISGASATAFEELKLDMIVSQEGYLYIYTTNESNSNVNVYFDDLEVVQQGGQVLSKTDYYPFGLIIDGLSTNPRSGFNQNKYLYNGKELQNELGLDWYDYGARMYDPAVGRFFTQDRFAEKYYSLNPYQYAANNPILYIDVNGDSIDVSGIQSSGQAIVLWLFAQTSEGRAFLSKYAKKGQSVYGHTFEEDGEFHCSGINLKINVKSMGEKNAANGETDYSEDGGYFNIAINLNSDLNGKGYAGNDEAAAFSKALTDYRNGTISAEELNNISNAFYFDRLKTLTHEGYIHSDRLAKDYASGERNLLKLSKSEVGRKTHLLENASPNTPFQKAGLRILMNSNNYLKLNKTEGQIKEQMMEFRR